MLSMKKSHEYVRLFQAIIKVGKFAHFYKSAYIEAKREGKEGRWAEKKQVLFKRVQFRHLS